MDAFRQKQLEWLWGEEDSTDESQEYRDTLTPEEAAYIDSLDTAFELGMAKLIQDNMARRV